MIDALHIVRLPTQLFRQFASCAVHCGLLAISNLQRHGVGTSKHAKSSNHQSYIDEQSRTAKACSGLCSASVAMQADTRCRRQPVVCVAGDGLRRGGKVVRNDCQKAALSGD